MLDIIDDDIYLIVSETLLLLISIGDDGIGIVDIVIPVILLVLFIDVDDIDRLQSFIHLLTIYLLEGIRGRPIPMLLIVWPGKVFWPFPIGIVDIHLLKYY